MDSMWAPCRLHVDHVGSKDSPYISYFTWTLSGLLVDVRDRSRGDARDNTFTLQYIYILFYILYFIFYILSYFIYFILFYFCDVT